MVTGQAAECTLSSVALGAIGEGQLRCGLGWRDVNLRAGWRRDRRYLPDGTEDTSRYCQGQLKEAGGSLSKSCDSGTRRQWVPCSDSKCPLSIFWGFQSVQSLSHVQLFETPWLQHIRLPCPSPTPRAYSNSCALSRWCHPTISSSIVPFSPCLQSFAASGSFPRSQFFASGSQSIGVSASASVLSVNIQDWFPLGSEVLNAHKHIYWLPLWLRG